MGRAAEHGAGPIGAYVSPFTSTALPSVAPPSRCPAVADAHEEGNCRTLAAIEGVLARAAAHGEVSLERVSAREAAEHFVAIAHAALRRSALLGRAPWGPVARSGRARSAACLVVDKLRPEQSA